MPIDLFAPFSIRGLQLPNRFMRSATYDRTADPSGAVTDASLAIYDALGRGNIGLIVTAYAFIAEAGRAGYGQYGIHSNQMIPGLRQMVKLAHQGNSKIAVQIVHTGLNINAAFLREKGTSAMVVSRIDDIDKPQREMSEADIQSIIEQFAAATIRAREIGFDAVQLHGAHGFLISQFQSPLFNHRTDKWGGNPENRRRFHLEVIRRVRRAVGPDFPLLIKYGAWDDREEGLTLAEGVETARQMVDAGIDGIEVSVGVGSATKPVLADAPERPLFRDLTVAVKRAVTVPVALVGGVRSLALSTDIINSGDADMISMSRPFIREPGLIARWQTGDQTSATCISCSKCMGAGPFLCPEEQRQKQSAQ